ncbi:hypothetical protein SGLAM104S_01171 [Streptomyces glaucescens]
MRGATHAKWVACATAAALAATACGGGGDGGGGAGGEVLSSSWGDPQNPLEHGQHQRGAGRQGARHGLPRAQAVRPGDRRGRGHARREDRDHRPAELHHHRQGRLDLQQWRESDGEVLRRRLELRRRPEEQPAQRVLLQLHPGLRQGPPGEGRAERRHALWAEGHRRAHLHRRPRPEVVHLPRHPRLQRLRPAAPRLLRRPRRLAGQTGRKRPLHRSVVHPGLPDVPAQVGGVPRPGQGAERRRRPQGLHRQQHRLHRPHGRQPRSGRRRPRRPAPQRPKRPRRPLPRHPRRHHPDPGLPVLRQELGQGRHGQGPQGPLHGHRPRADHRDDLPENPHTRHRLDLPGARCGRRLQGGAVRGRLRVPAGRGGRSSSRRAAGSPAARSGSPTTRTLAPTRTGSTRSATPSTTPSTTTGPASATPSAPSPTSASRSPRTR